MDNFKRIIYRSEQTYAKSNDQRIKAISLRTIKTAKKYLEELETEIQEMPKEYEKSKIKLKSLI